jgi:hypothetical protein
MSDPKQQQEERDELELDSEPIKDLEPDEENADDIRGGGGSKHFNPTTLPQ